MLTLTVVSLQLVLTAAPVGGVALVKRAGANRTEAMARAALVKTQLEVFVPSLAGVDDATDCAAKLPCLLKFARDRQWTTLVAVETATVFEEVIVSVRSYSVEEDGRLLDTANVKTTTTALESALRAALVPLAAQLKTMSGQPDVHLATGTANTADAAPAPRDVPAPSVAPPIAAAELAAAPPLIVQGKDLRSENEPRSGGIGPFARWVPLGVSLAILGGGAAAYAASRGDADALRTQRLPESTIAETVQRGKLLQTIGVAGMISGAVLAAGSVVFALTVPTPKPTVSLVVAPTPLGLDVALSGSFP
jgi:hypothetical protein